MGLFMRISVASKPTSIFRFAIMNSMIVLSPCGFIAGVYMLLSRLAIHLGATELLEVKAQKLTRIFVTSDIITFLIQGGGGGLMAAMNDTMRNIGSKIFLVGLILQVISFLVFTYIFVVFVYRLHKHHKYEWENRPQGVMQHWLAIVISMTISCVFIIIRSVYRMIENGETREGPLATHEAYFYVLDCLAIWLAIGVYLIAWPPKYLTNYRSSGKEAIALNQNMGSSKP